MKSLAAQYLRMSTEYQQYSLDNQSAAIADYARKYDFEIVRTYSDEAKSGLTIAGRPGLRALIADITIGRAEFTAVLVLDVSRWGRFQDADEAAHYEFLCKLAGIKVHYCAEPFSSMEGLVGNLLKALKRSMAAEYSRELSTKTFVGQCRIVQNGFKVGGAAGYGLRRLLLDQSGAPKAILRHGEQKSLAKERVIYTLGTEAELGVIRSIYTMFLGGNSVASITRQLNRLRIPREVPGPWNHPAVDRILTHPKYMGSIVFNRSSSRLHTRKIKNAPQQWVTNPDRFPAIISPEVFRQVQEKLADNVHGRSDTRLMQDLRTFLRKHGRLSTKLICPANGLASYMVYRKRFGSMRQVYDLVPYRLTRTFVPASEAKRSIKLRADIHNQFANELADAHLSFAVSGNLFTLFGYGMFSFEIGRCVRTEHARSLRWRVTSRRDGHKHPCLVVRLDPDNRLVHDCCLLGRIPQFKVRFSVSDDVVQSSAIIRPTTAEMVRFIAGVGESWFVNWAQTVRLTGR